MNERLFALRKSAGLSQEELSEMTGLNKKAYAQYENGERKITLNAAIRLAEFYHVSLDYMAGLTDSTERH